MTAIVVVMTIATEVATRGMVEVVTGVEDTEMAVMEADMEVVEVI